MFVILKIFLEFKIDCYSQNGFTKQSIHRHARRDTISIKINHQLMRFDSNLIIRDRTSSRWSILAESDEHKDFCCSSGNYNN